MTVEIYQDSAGEWRWRAISRNNKIIADSAEGYAKRGNAKRSATRFCKLAQTAELRVN